MVRWATRQRRRVRERRGRADLQPRPRAEVGVPAGGRWVGREGRSVEGGDWSGKRKKRSRRARRREKEAAHSGNDNHKSGRSKSGEWSLRCNGTWGGNVLRWRGTKYGGTAAVDETCLLSRGKWKKKKRGTCSPACQLTSPRVLAVCLAVSASIRDGRGGKTLLGCHLVRAGSSGSRPGAEVPPLRCESLLGRCGKCGSPWHLPAHSNHWHLSTSGNNPNFPRETAQ